MDGECFKGDVVVMETDCRHFGERGTLPKIVPFVREKPEAFLLHIANVVSVHVARCAVCLSLIRSLAKTSLRCIVKLFG